MVYAYEWYMFISNTYSRLVLVHEWHLFMDGSVHERYLFMNGWHMFINGTCSWMFMSDLCPFTLALRLRNVGKGILIDDIWLVWNMHQYSTDSRDNQSVWCVESDEEISFYYPVARRMDKLTPWKRPGRVQVFTVLHVLSDICTPENFCFHFISNKRLRSVEMQ